MRSRATTTGWRLAASVFLGLILVNSAFAQGELRFCLRSEPKTINPVLAVDEPSRDVIRCVTADLIHINRGSLKTEPSLAKSWKVSNDGRQYTPVLETAKRNSPSRVASRATTASQRRSSLERSSLPLTAAPLCDRAGLG